ncbi:MAG: hypothetical protein VX681_00825 [Myxococcota bacterium]|nr:hypothetical protein [Myxococcota bacterium]
MEFPRALQAVAAAAAVMLYVCAAGTASALAFTLDSPVVIDSGNNALGVDGVLRPVFDLSGSLLLSDVGGNLTPNEGGASTSSTGQDIFVVDLILNSGSSSVDALGITVGSPFFFLNPQSAGAFDDTGSGDIGPTSVLADSVSTLAGVFTFGTPLAANQTSVRLFVTHTSEGDIAAGQTVTFMVSSGTDFTVQGTTASAPVPEPGAGMLLQAGLLLWIGVGAHRSRRS